MNFNYLAPCWRAFREGRMGDAAVFKGAMLGTDAFASVQQRLETLPQPFPDPDIRGQRWPAQSFGAEYLAFLARNRLQPLSLSAATRASIGPAEILVVRYTLLHDAFHVLLGFDASLAGEAGVWSFVGAQQYAPQHACAARWAARLYPLMQPRQRHAIAAAVARGQRLSEGCDCLIAQPIEAWWGEPLGAVRARVGLAD